MGNKQSSTQLKQTIEHEKLGPIRVFQITQINEQGEDAQLPVMQVTRNVLEKKHYDQWTNQLKKIDDDEGLELFLVPSSHSFEKAGLCGSSGFVKIVFNKFEFVLSSEIKNRNNLNKFFDQTQIWYVLYNLVRAGNKFETLKQKIGDIHPNNILINEDGQTAIITRFSLPQEPDNFQKFLEDRKAEVFLAPQQMKPEDTERGAYNQKLDKCLAEVFSIGLTVLSAGTLQHCNDVYQREPFKINSQRLGVLIDQFSKRYSPFLTQTLRSLLEINPEKRARSKKLYDELSKYEQQILELEAFEVQDTNSGYNQYPPQNAYYNQPYQPYSSLPHAPQPVQTSFIYAPMNGSIGNPPPGNPQYVPNVRWNDNPTYVHSYKSP